MMPKAATLAQTVKTHQIPLLIVASTTALLQLFIDSTYCVLPHVLLSWPENIQTNHILLTMKWMAQMPFLSRV
jgi:hypothetical protein